MTRLIAFLFASLAAAALHATNLTVTPAGDVRAVRQVSLRFDQPMVALGADAPAPGDLRCTHPNAAITLPPASGRWANERDWVFEFPAPLPAGTRCVVRVKPSLADLTGQTVSVSRHAVDFRVLPLGYHHPRVLRDESPGQVRYALLLNHPDPRGGVATLATSPFVCDVFPHAPGRESAISNPQPPALSLPARRLSEAELRRQYRQQLLPKEPWALALSCEGDLPDGAQIQLRRRDDPPRPSPQALLQDSEQAGHERFLFLTRAPFRATLSCGLTTPRAPNRPASAEPVHTTPQVCDARQPISLRLSTPVTRATAEAVHARLKVREPDGRTHTLTPELVQADPRNDTVHALQWRLDAASLAILEAPWHAEVALHLEALRDPLARPLTNPDVLRTLLRLEPPPPYLGPVAIEGQIVPLHAPPELRQLWFATRRLEPELPLQRWHLRQLDAPGRLARAAQLLLASRQPHTLSDAQWQQLLADLPATDTTTLRVPQRSVAFQGIPVHGPGLHIARVTSAAYARAQAEAMAATGKTPDTDARADTSGTRWQVAQLSNLAVTASLAEHGDSVLWVTRLDRAQPVAHAHLSLYDCQLRPLWQGRTDTQGAIRLPAKLQVAWHACSLDASAKTPFLRSEAPWVHVKTADDELLTPLTSGPQSWAEAASPVQAHLVLDRSLLQAGDTLHAQLLVRLPTAQGFDLPKSDPVQLEIFDPFNEKIAILQSKIDETGQAQVSWPVPANAALGHYRLVARRSGNPVGHPQPAYRRPQQPPMDDEAWAEAAFRIEAFRRPLFDAQLTISQRPGERMLNMQAQLSYFAGGTAQGTPVHWQHQWQPTDEGPVPGYTFFTPTRASELTHPAPLPASSATLGADGTAHTRLPLPALARPWRLVSEMRFDDPNGETQTVAHHTTLWPWAERLGLRWEAATASRPARIAGVLVDASGQPLANRPITMHAAPAQSVATRQPGLEGSHWQAMGAATPLCNTHSDAHGQWHCTWTPPADEPSVSWLVTAKAMGSPNGSPVTALVVHGWQGRYAVAEDELVVHNGPDLAPGEVARIETRPLRLPASVLLTSEREGVREHRVVTLTQAVQHIDWPLTAADAPNLQLRAQYVYPWTPNNTQAHEERAMTARHLRPPQPPVPSAGASALYSHQTARLRVAPSQQTLAVTVTPARPQTLPASELPVQVQVRTADGHPVAHAQLTVAVVDEALLALSPNPTQQVIEAMWRERPISVGARTVLHDIVQHVPTPPQASWLAPDETRAVARLAKADAVPMPAPAPVAAAAAPMALERSTKTQAAEEAPNPPVRREFNSLLYWRSGVTTDARGDARLRVPVNDNLTRYRIVVIATHGADHFGEGQAHFEVNQPLQLLSGLPSLVRAGDELTQKLTLRNTSNQPLTVQVDVQATPVPATDALTPRPMDAAAAQRRGLQLRRTLTVTAGSAQTLLWRLQVPDGVTQLNWTMHARAPGREQQAPISDTLVVSQRVVPAQEATVRQSTLLPLKDPIRVPIVQPAGARPGLGGVRVSLAPSLVASALQETRRWMQDYPYTCLEQQTARAVVLDDRAEWERLMAILPQYLDHHGLARFFPESSLPGSESLTVQLLDLAHATGWGIPDAARERMLDALTNLARGQLPPQDWTPTRDVTAARLAAQATLAEHGRPVLHILPEDLSRLPPQSLLDWARTVAALPESQRPIGRAASLEAVQAQLRSRFDVQGSMLRWRDEAGTLWPWRLWSGDATAARMVLWALDRSHREGQSQWQADAPRIVQGLVARQQRGRWLSTAANAWAAVALTRFAQNLEAGSVDGQTQLQLQAQPDGPAVSRTANWQTQPTEPLLLPWPQHAARAELKLEHQGNGQPWATAALLAAVPVTAPTAQGLAVHRTIEPVEQRVPGRWSVGDVYRVRLTMTANAPQAWVVVRDALPSGASSLKRGLGRDSQLAATDRAAPPSSWAARPSVEEHAPDSYRAYYRWVGEGKWQLEYTVRLNNAGMFTLPPTRVEALYAPDVFGEVPAAPLEVHP